MKAFGGKPKPSPNKGGNSRSNAKAQANKATVQLRETVTTLEKREKHLEKQIDQLTKKAKMLVAKKEKKKALAVLKKKKLLDTQLERLGNKKLNLETQIMTLEESITNTEVINGMRTANNAMTNINQSFDVDKIDELREDMAENQDLQTEVNELLGESFDYGIDEDDLMAELDEMEELQVEEELADLPQVDTAATNQVGPNTSDLLADLPQAPAKPAKQKIVDDDEAELAALMM